MWPVNQLKAKVHLISLETELKSQISRAPNDNPAKKTTEEGSTSTLITHRTHVR